MQADAAQHLRDAITSVAAFFGISVALLGTRFRGGLGWESADDWAALAASAVIAFNGISMIRVAMHDLMDRMPDQSNLDPIRTALLGVNA